MKKRIVWIDILRLIGILMVLTIHVVGNSVNTFNLGGDASTFYKILSGISASSISLFVMISGMMFLGKNITYKDLFKKYIPKILFGIVVIGFIYSMMELVYINNGFKISLIYDSIMKIIHIDTWAHMWYLYLVLILYLLTPVIKMVTDKLDKNKYIMAIIIYIIIGLSLSLFNGIHPIINSLIILYWYVLYYIYGYFLYKFDLSIYTRLIHYFGAILSIIYIISLVAKTNALEVINYISIPVFFIASGLILLLKNIKFKDNKITKQINNIGICSYGIYIIHQFFINIIFKVLKLDIVVDYPILLPIYILVIFGLSYGVIYTLRKNKFISKYVF